MEGSQRGFTLVELLAVLTLATVCFSLIFSIWLSGQKSANHTMAENDLQSDANLVQKRLTEAFYDKNQKPFTLSLNDGRVELNDDESGETQTISDAELVYSGTPVSVEVNQNTKNLALDYTIKPKNTAEDGDLSFHLDTTLHYPWSDGGSGDSQ
ncbi:type II secretion system protein [Sporolactobacillus vineae]|uniref:type II secretion system protein n=1 Tax=Sporolactobacillus vineae TaxID=444463 RepID=UPI000288A81B|nr:type II secretion system protein [Sporolactobacillus vineae]